MKRALLLLALTVLPLSACAGFQEFLDTPVGEPAAPVEEPPVTVALPDGGEVTYTPAPPPPADQYTLREFIPDWTGTVASVLGQNPAFGVVLSGALSALLSRLKKD